MFSNFKFNLSNKTEDSNTTETNTTETNTTETNTTETNTTETNHSITEPLFNINFDGEEHKVSAEYLVSMIEKQGDIIDNLRKENTFSPLVLKKEDNEVRLTNQQCLEYIKQLNDHISYLVNELKNCHHVFYLISEKYDLSEFMTKPPEMEEGNQESNEEININLDDQ